MIGLLLVSTVLLGPAATVTEAVHDLMGARDLDPAVRQAQVLAVAHRVMDFEGMARAALGETAWEALTIPERAIVAHAFERFLGQLYLDRVADLVSPEGLVILSERTVGDRAEVASRLAVKGDEWDVVLHLRGGAGAWRIVDLVVGGVSLVANYRSQFRTILRREGSAGLLKRLEQP